MGVNFIKKYKILIVDSVRYAYSKQKNLGEWKGGWMGGWMEKRG